ncbi:hypothetical protein AMECASPLE_037804, partial [Ameca splendens]
LGPAGSRKEQPSRQVLSDESRPQAWLQGGTPAPPYRATSEFSPELDVVYSSLK